VGKLRHKIYHGVARKPLTNSFAVVVVQERKSRSDNIKRPDVQGYPVEQSFVGVQELTEVTQAFDILVPDERDKSLDIHRSHLAATR
jgi:hypothetical protein